MIKKAYLVQSAKINKPLNNYRNKKISDAVDLAYMGSAEFEFGALPKSNRTLFAINDTSGLKVTKATLTRGYDAKFDTKPGEQSLDIWVLHGLADEDFAKYLEDSITAIFRDKIRLKETTGFEYNSRQYKTKNDFFWDIENHVMWSTDKMFMKRIMTHLKASWEVMGCVSINSVSS